MGQEASCLINESFHLKEVSYEFSFPDAHYEKIAKIYRPQEQLLSVYFHEEWILDTKNHEFIKKVEGITPVIWHLRQTTDGEPIQDAESGLPVYFKTKLERIDLRYP